MDLFLPGLNDELGSDVRFLLKIRVEQPTINSVERYWQKYYDEGVPATLDYPDLNMFQVFESAVQRNPGGTATLFFGAEKTFQTLDREVDQFSRGLAALGIGKGDRVALVLPNLPGYPLAHLAALKLGAVVVPTNPLYVERELRHQLNDSGARAVVIFDQLFFRLEKVRKETAVENIIVMSVKDFLPRLLGILYGLKNRSPVEEDQENGIYLFSRFRKRQFPPHSAEEVAPEDTAILLYTGGTTGVSKGAELTHRNLVVNVHQTRAWLWSMEDEKETLLCVLPFFHSYGMTTGMHLAILSRSAMLLLPRFELTDVAKQIKKHRPTIFCGVPSMYNAINRYEKLSEQDVSSIRLCISGGAALPVEVQRRFEQKTGGKLVEGYGLTETSPVAAVNPTHGHRKSGTIGIPVPNTDARIVEPETGEGVPDGEVGELALRGPQVMKGYWNMPDETAKVLRNGWLHTGDMATVDEEGFITIVDRKKDVIISAGMNVYPREVEEVLQQHPAIMEAAVVGEPSRVREEVVKAFVILEEGAELSKAELIVFCRDKLSKYKIPRKVEFVEELPKSALGKVLKRELTGHQ